MNMNVKKNEVKEMAMMLNSCRNESRKSLCKALFAETPTALLRVKRQARNSSIYNNLTK